MRAEAEGLVKPHFTCTIHKEYKEYQEHLLNYKNWCIVFCTILLIPLCLFGWAVNLNLAWTYYFTGTLISSAVVPIMLSIVWARTTAAGMNAGAIGGCVLGIASWLGYASQEEGGLAPEVFIENTGKEFPMLIGNLVSFLGGAILSIIVSLFTKGSMDSSMVNAEWEKTRDIDNPLNPWVLVYKDDLNFEAQGQGARFHDRPALEIVVAKFRPAKITAYVAGLFFTILFVFIWPSSMLSTEVMDTTGFTVWTILSRIWAIVAAGFIITVPLIQEAAAIFKQHKENKKAAVRESKNGTKMGRMNFTNGERSSTQPTSVL